MQSMCVLGTAGHEHGCYVGVTEEQGEWRGNSPSSNARRSAFHQPLQLPVPTSPSQAKQLPQQEREQDTQLKIHLPPSRCLQPVPQAVH